jgi:hypothetical protein
VQLEISLTYGKCVIEEVNRRKISVFGPQHPDVKAFIQKEDNDCRRWNNYVKRINQTMGAGLTPRNTQVQVRIHLLRLLKNYK